MNSGAPSLRESPDLATAIHRLSRFVDGETPRTLYRCNLNGVWRFDAMRDDVGFLLRALESARKDGAPPHPSTPESR